MERTVYFTAALGSIWVMLCPGCATHTGRDTGHGADDDSASVDTAGETGMGDDTGDCNDDGAGTLEEMVLSDADATLLGDGNGVLAGIVAGAGDMNGDGLGDVLVGAYGVDALGKEFAGAVYLYHGPVSGVRVVSDADAVLYGSEENDGAGVPVWGPGDVNGDGYADVLVGSWREEGAAWIVHGPLSGVLVLSNADAEIVGPAGLDLGQMDIEAVGDTDGDAWTDFAVSGDYSTEYRGDTYLFKGPLTGTVGVDVASTHIEGEAAGDYAEEITTVGDLDGDGFADVVVGAPGNDSEVGGDGYDVGAAYVLYGPVSGGVSLSEADAKLSGEVAHDSAGYVNGIGDFDGDGADDLAVGAIYHKDACDDETGVVYMLMDPPVGKGNLASEPIRLFGGGPGDQVGSPVRSVGDVNGDHAPDLLVGATGIRDLVNDPVGGAYLVLGPFSGSARVSECEGWKVSGIQSGSGAGLSVSGAGDVDGDGSPEILIGAPWYDFDDYSLAGAAYLLSVSGL